MNVQSEILGSLAKIHKKKVREIAWLTGAFLGSEAPHLATQRDLGAAEMPFKFKWVTVSSSVGAMQSLTECHPAL